LEEEMDLVWCTIEKYKNLEKNKRSEIIWYKL
jgi:hypothetical protein